MMGRRAPLIDGDEFDAVTRWRHVLIWRAGQRSATKRRIRRRERREGAAAWRYLCDWLDELDAEQAEAEALTAAEWAELGYDPDACRRDTEWNMYRRADEQDGAA